MPTVRRTSRAMEDLLEIWLFIAADNPGQADRWTHRMELRLNDLAAYPRSGRPRPDLGRQVRSINVGDYLVFYHAVEDGIVVLRVLHGSRDVDPDDMDHG